MAVLGLLSFIWHHLVLIVVTSTLNVLAAIWLRPGLRSVPGPFLAKFSDIWRYYDVAKGRSDITLYKLHQKHGDYVRLGPSAVSVNNVDVLKMIYGINSGYAKVCILML